MSAYRLPIIYKYLTLQALKYVGILLISIVGIYIAVDFFERVDNFLDANLPVTRVFVYLFLKTPVIISQILPVAVFLSVLTVIGLMARNNEIVALKSGGVSIYFLLVPLLAMGLFYGIILFAMNEVLTPLANRKCNQIWLEEVKQKRALISSDKNIWIRGSQLITHMRFYDAAKKEIQDITIFYFDENFKLLKRVDAQKGVYEKDHWQFYNLLEQVHDQSTGQIVSKPIDQRSEAFDFLPEDLTRVVKKSDELSLGELYRYIRDVEAEGYDATLYRVDFQAKLAFPFICIILSVIGLGLSAYGTRRLPLPVIIGMGIVVVFIYWFGYSFLLSLGYGRVVPPFLAAWLTNFIFICLGAYILISAE